MMNETLSLGGRRIGIADSATVPTQSHLSPLLTFPAGGAAIGGLIGYGIKRNVRGAAVGALAGAVAPFVLAAAVIASGWRP